MHSEVDGGVESGSHFKATSGLCHIHKLEVRDQLVFLSQCFSLYLTKERARTRRQCGVESAPNIPNSLLEEYVEHDKVD